MKSTKVHFMIAFALTCIILYKLQVSFQEGATGMSGPVGTSSESTVDYRGTGATGSWDDAIFLTQASIDANRSARESVTEFERKYLNQATDALHADTIANLRLLTPNTIDYILKPYKNAVSVLTKLQSALTTPNPTPNDKVFPRIDHDPEQDPLNMANKVLTTYKYAL